MARAKLTVRRKGYRRKGYYRKDGTYVRPARVSPSTFKIADRGAPGRGKKVFKVKKGLLTRLGYHVSLPARRRRAILKKADKLYGSVRLWRMLNAQHIYRKRTDGIGKIFASDRDWVKKNLINTREARSMTRPAVQKWKSMSPTARKRAMPSWSPERRLAFHLSRLA